MLKQNSAKSKHTESKDSSLRFHLWSSGIFGFKGGIQVYSLFFLKALQAIYPSAEYRVFLKNDAVIPSQTDCLPHTKFHPLGKWILCLRTPIFALQLFIWGLWARPDLLIVGHLNFAAVADWLNRLTGISYWIVVYGVEAWDVRKPSTIRALFHADRILSIGEFTRDRLLETHAIAPEKIAILPCTFDPERFAIAPKPQHLLEHYRLQPQQKIILTVCRLLASEQYKGYQQILMALPKIRLEIPNIHYLIVGKGDDSDRILSLIRELGLQNCVTLTGFIPDAELCDHYNLCDVFAMPSKREGFGIVYLEALACGKPTLGGDRDGAIDALCHGKLGALVNPDNVTEIAETIVKILKGTHANDLIYQPQTLRERVISTFGFARFKQTLAIYLQQHFEQAIGTSFQKSPKG
jgi:glycosyltransferase involved in cell wall biosynthesis